MNTLTLIAKIRLFILTLSKILFIIISLYYIWHYKAYSLSINMNPFITLISWIPGVQLFIGAIEKIGLTFLIIPLSIVIISLLYPDNLPLKIISSFFAVGGVLFSFFHMSSLAMWEEKFTLGIITIYHQTKFQDKVDHFHRLFDLKIHELAVQVHDVTQFKIYMAQQTAAKWEQYVKGLHSVNVSDISNYVDRVTLSLYNLYIKQYQTVSSPDSDFNLNDYISSKFIIVAVLIAIACGTVYYVYSHNRFNQMEVDSRDNAKNISIVSEETKLIRKDLEQSLILTQEKFVEHGRLLIETKTELVQESTRLKCLVETYTHSHNYVVTELPPLLAGIKTDLDEKQANIATINNSVREVNSNVDSVIGLVSNLNGKLESYSKTKDTLYSDIGSTVSTTTSPSISSEQFIQRVVELETRVKSLNEIAVTVQGLEGLEKRLRADGFELSELKSVVGKVANLEKKYDTMRAEVRAQLLGDIQANFDTTASKLKDVISETYKKTKPEYNRFIKDQQKNVEDSMNRLKNELEDHVRQQLDFVTRQNVNLEEQSNYFKETVVNFAEKVQGLVGAQIAKFNTEVVSPLKKQVQTLETNTGIEHEMLRQEIKSHEATMNKTKALEEKILALQTRVSDVESDSHFIQNTMNKQKTEVSEAKRETEEAKEMVQDFAIQLRTNMTRVDALIEALKKHIEFGILD